jgi:hypothetical protein
MTVVEPEQYEIDLAPGASFTHSTGRAVLVSPTDPAHPSDRLWLVWNPATGSLEEIVVGAVTWDTDPLPFAEIFTGLAEGWSQLQAEHEHTRVQLARTEERVQEMRVYAINKHLAGHYCRDGLNEALEHFELEPYEPRYRVQVTVTAVFVLSANTSERAYNRARYLVDGIAYSGSTEEDELEVTEEDTQVDVLGIIDE